MTLNDVPWVVGYHHARSSHIGAVVGVTGTSDGVRVGLTDRVGNT